MSQSLIIGAAELFNADCRDVLRQLPDCSVDSIVTDPPYELGFMGKAWDASGIAYDVGLWREAMRVLKPGGHLLAFGGSRTYHRLACAIEDAGFEIRDQIMWVYGSGFPKSLDVSKAIDNAAGAKREVVGVKSVGNGNGRGEGFRHDGDTSGVPVTAPATDEAKQWHGWGTALKPAHEPVVVARKPLAGTIAQNVLAHGAGALNIDGCRVATDDILTGSGSAPLKHGGQNHRPFHDKAEARGCNQSPLGRWPANLIHDGSDEVVALFPAEAGQQAAVNKRNSDKFRNTFGEFAGTKDVNFVPHDGIGSAARFFYCAKVSTEEREEGLKLALKPVAQGNQAQAELKRGNLYHAGNSGMNTIKMRANHHPTVKPIALCRYLQRLVTPAGGTTMDLFMGSGSFGVAAVLEGFRFIGIENDTEHGYFDISAGRISYAITIPKQQEMFA